MRHVLALLRDLACLPFARISKRWGFLYDRWQAEQLQARLDAEEIGSCLPVEMEVWREQKRLERFP